MEQIAEREPMIRRAMMLEDVFTQNEEQRRFYEMREKGRRDFESAIIHSERRGKLEGLLEGKREVARSMLANAMPLDLISKLTGLSVEEIDALR